MELRDKIAELVFLEFTEGPLIFDEFTAGRYRMIADEILAIPDLADALRACQDGGELDVYRSNCRCNLD